jgi:hypothetical protein
MNTELQAVSNVIEIKPGKKYLLVFKGEGVTDQALQRIVTGLRLEGIDSVGVALDDGQELTVIEVPEGIHNEVG